MINSMFIVYSGAFCKAISDDGDVKKVFCVACQDWPFQSPCLSHITTTNKPLRFITPGRCTVLAQ